MYEKSINPTTVCEITGRSLITLRKIGDKLSVDRINNDLPYIPGNTRIIALSLNIAKKDRLEVPRRAINKLQRRLLRVVNDKWSIRRDDAGEYVGWASSV